MNTDAAHHPIIRYSKTAFKDGIPAVDTIILSEDHKFRYLEFRQIDMGNPFKTAAFILLRPGYEEESCFEWARQNGYGELITVYLFSVFGQELELQQDPDPIGSHTDPWIGAMCEHMRPRGREIICAWGPTGAYLEREKTAISEMSEFEVKLKCFGIQDGQPIAPSKYNARLNDFIPRNN